MSGRIVITGGFRFNRNDAAAVRVLGNARIFRSLGYEVVFVCWGGDYLEIDRMGDAYFKDGFEYIISGDLLDGASRNPFRRLYNFLFSGRKSVKTILGYNPDTIIAYNPPAYFNHRMLTLSRKSGIHYAADITEWYDPREFPGGKWMPFSWLNDYNMSVIHKKVRNKIVISSFLDRYYGDSNNVIIPPLIDPADGKWNGTVTSEMAPYMGLTLIFAGVSGIKDALGNIIRGVCLAKDSGVDLRLVILGGDMSEISRVIGGELSEKYRETILPLGMIPQELVPSYYKSADFSFVVREPSRKNMAGFPTKFVESMASGTPVIANATSDLGNYLVDGQNGFVIEDWGQESVAGLLIRTKDLSEEKIKSMKAEAVKCAVENFSYEKYIEEVGFFNDKLMR